MSTPLEMEVVQPGLYRLIGSHIFRSEQVALGPKCDRSSQVLTSEPTSILHDSRSGGKHHPDDSHIDFHYVRIL